MSLSSFCSWAVASLCSVALWGVAPTGLADDALVLSKARSSAGECVILLHGLMRGPASMSRIATALSSEGYRVINQGYASAEQPIAQSASTAINRALAGCGPSDQYHFVTHSLGGILVRQYAADHPEFRPGRVVMLGPPNQGSEVVDKLRGNHWVSAIAGPAFHELSVDPAHSVPKSLGAVRFELGVIAGDRSVNWLLSTQLPGRDDGKVSVDSTRVEGMTDHVVLHTTHPFMTHNTRVLRQASFFLKHGKFQKI